MFKYMSDMGYKTYRTICESYILLVSNYAMGVWWFRDYPALQVLQNKMQRFVLGVHTYAPLPALHAENGLAGDAQVKMVRHNKII